eukprot:s792_g15.t1
MGGGSSETPAMPAAAETVENQTEGVEAQPGTPGTPKAKADERDRSRSPARGHGTESAPSGSAPVAATPPVKTPPVRRPPSADDGVTGISLAEAKATLAKAKENDAALSKITQKRLIEAAEALPGSVPKKGEVEEIKEEEVDDEEKPVILPRALLHRLGDLSKALHQQGVLHERHMGQACGALEKCAESLADLYKTVKVPTEMFAHIGSLADGVSYYAGEVKRMLSINKEEKAKCQWDWLQDPKAKKPMSAYVRELSASAASTSATTLSIQSDMSVCKGLLKQLLETMERAAIAAEKTSTILLQQGTGAMPVGPMGSMPAGPVAPEAPVHPEVAPTGPPATLEGSGAFAAYATFPPQQHQPKGGGKGKPGQILRSQAMPPMRPPAAPPVEPTRHPSAGAYLPGWGNSYETRTGGSDIPVPTNPPPEEIVVQWSGFAPMVAPNMNNDVNSNPPLNYELPVEVPNLKSMSASGIDRESGRRRRISPEGKQLSHRNATSAAYAPKGWTQSVNTLLFHRVYENL